MASEVPPAWSKVTLPLRSEEKLTPDGATLRVLRVYFRGRDEEFMNAWLDLDTLRLREHHVVEGETWESVAAAHQTTAHRLKVAGLVRAQIHWWGTTPFEEKPGDAPPLTVGQKVAVGRSERDGPRWTSP